MLNDSYKLHNQRNRVNLRNEKRRIRVSTAAWLRTEINTKLIPIFSLALSMLRRFNILNETAGIGTVKLTIPDKPEGNAISCCKIVKFQGCFIKNDSNFQHVIQEKSEYISVDWNKVDTGNLKYIFYTPVIDFVKKDVSKAVLSYKKISNRQTLPETFTLEKPLVITFDGHFFLCCDSKELNKNKFLEEHSKKVSILEKPDLSKSFYVLGIGDKHSCLQIIPFRMLQCQENGIYKTDDGIDYDKLQEAGPLILSDTKTIVGCYRKCSDGNRRIEINMFGKSQGHQERPHHSLHDPSEGDPSPTTPAAGPSQGDPARHSTPPRRSEENRKIANIKSQVFFLYDSLMLKTIRCIEVYIENGKDTLNDLKDRFRSQLEQNELEEIDTVRKLVRTLEQRGVIGPNNVELLKMLAEELELPKLQTKVEELQTKVEELQKKVEEFETKCSGLGDDPRSSTAIICMKIEVSSEVGEAVDESLRRMHVRNPKRLENLSPFVDAAVQLLTVRRGSVVFVFKVSSVSLLKQLWQSYKDGSFQEKLKKALNEMEELKEVSQGEEIDVEVTIDEEEYREILCHLMVMEGKGSVFLVRPA